MQTDTAEHSYTIKTGSFSGPFALLLALVEGKKLHINDVSLAEVTEDYIRYVNELEKKDPAAISSFIVVAAALILLKSKSLLPELGLTEGEESDIKSLEDRLRQYELYMRLSAHVRQAFGRRVIFPLEERKPETLVFLPDAQITRQSMMAFARDMLDRLPKKTALAEVEVKKVISIEEMIDKLAGRIQDSLKMNFREFSNHARGPRTKEEKVLVIVSFLAMLELTRQGIIEVTQENNFDDIIMEKQI